MKPIVALVIIAALSGCTTNTYERKRGDDYVKFTRNAFGLNQQIGELSVTTDASGVQTLAVKGYANKDSDMAAAVVGAAVKAAMPKP